MYSKFSFVFFQQPEQAPAHRRILEFADNTVLYYIFEHELFRLSNHAFKLIDIFILVVGFLIFIWLSRLLRRYVISRLLERAKFHAGTTQLAGLIAQYSIIFLGFVITLQIIGIDLTSLNLLAGAIGVAIGFGLQTIANNFVSGLIIVFENPFQVNDRIEIGTVTGKIVEIGGRSTKIQADDETIHIIPNQKLVTENVRSFRRLSEHIPHEIKIPVGYGNDANKVLEALQRAAENHPQVLPEPKPNARLKAFDVAKLDFVLNIWTAKDMKGTEQFLSELNVQIYKEFLQNGITPNTPFSANVNLRQTN